MAESRQVKCINKTDRQNPHERIVNIGGTHADGTRWKLSQQQAIAGIELGTWSFYVQAGGRTVRAVVATSGYGKRYLKTEADSQQPDNVLSLDECP